MGDPPNRWTIRWLTRFGSLIVAVSGGFTFPLRCARLSPVPLTKTLAGRVLFGFSQLPRRKGKLLADNNGTGLKAEPA